MAIPSGITLDDVREAAARLDAGEPRKFGRAKKYLAVVDGKSYPPKALVGLAARRLVGRDLTRHDFSSGLGTNRAVGVLRRLGVAITKLDGTPLDDTNIPEEDSLAALCLHIVETYHEQPEKLTKEAVDGLQIREVGRRLEAIATEVSPREGWQGGASAGKGRWATVPWAALFHRSITTTAQRGVYPVIHFHADDPRDPSVQAGVRVGIGISATENSTKIARLKRREILGRELQRLAGEDPLPGFWFALSNEPQPSPSPRGQWDPAYSEGMVLERCFTAYQLENDPDEFEEVIRRLVRLYAHWIDGQDEPDLRHPPSLWVIAPGDGGRYWNECLEHRIVTIGWDYLGDLSAFGSQDEVAERIKAHDGDDIEPHNNSLACWEFSRAVRPGDIVIAKAGRQRLLGVGRVTSDYRHEPTRAEHTHVRSVDWLHSKPMTLPEGIRFPRKTLTRLLNDSPLAAFVRENYLNTPSPRPVPSPTTYGIDSALADVFLPREDMEAMVTALRQRKNVILQGPPGVGKSFIARRVAWLLMGQQDDSRLQVVQFHQSYSYEDFVQGWRPSPLGFVRRDGPFLEFCARARGDLGRPHVFIIDEINRGNVSKILGELLMLIEHDKRGDRHAIPLTYSDRGERFAVPENMHILGLMNTADRSLAMVDYALRRRFRFFDLRPQFDSPAFERSLLDSGAPPELVALIRDKLGELNRRIAADTKNLGEGLQIGHSFFCPNGDGPPDAAWYRSVVENEIEPLLREYWFDRRETARKWATDLLSGLAE